MLAKPHAENENRLEVLRSLKILDTGTEKIYDDLTQLTADICDAPICLVSLVEDDRQWFKSEVGLGISETTLENSICSHAVKQDAYLEIRDTLLDKRTIDNPLCQGQKPIRFYAGAILRSFSGFPLGTLCVLDFHPRALSEFQKRALNVHAKNIMQQLELTRALIQEVRNSDRDTENANATAKLSVYHQKAKSRFETLTPREKEIMKLFAGRSGSLSSKEVARELEISPRTVDHHRANIMSKMQVDSIAELMAVGLKAGIFR